MMKFSRGLLLVAVALLAACAQSPQRINVAPTLTMTGSDMTGNGRAIIVSASDQRPSKVLGSLGGVYGDTATLTIGNNLEQALTQAANGMLAAQGYVVNSPDPSAVQLNIVVERISYEKVNQQPVGNIVKLSAVLRADVTRQGETYTGRYTTESEHPNLARPDPEDNEKYVNDLLADTLKRMFGDNRLREFLTR